MILNDTGAQTSKRDLVKIIKQFNTDDQANYIAGVKRTSVIDKIISYNNINLNKTTDEEAFFSKTAIKTPMWIYGVPCIPKEFDLAKLKTLHRPSDRPSCLVAVNKL